MGINSPISVSDKLLLRVRFSIRRAFYRLIHFIRIWARKVAVLPMLTLFARIA